VNLDITPGATFKSSFIRSFYPGDSSSHVYNWLSSTPHLLSFWHIITFRRSAIGRLYRCLRITSSGNKTEYTRILSINENRSLHKLHYTLSYAFTELFFITRRKNRLNTKIQGVYKRMVRFQKCIKTITFCNWPVLSPPPVSQECTSATQSCSPTALDRTCCKWRQSHTHTIYMGRIRLWCGCVSCDPGCTHWRIMINAKKTCTVAASDGVRWEINFFLIFETAPYFCKHPVFQIQPTTVGLQKISSTV
jgi:hypothetical protein